MLLGRELKDCVRILADDATKAELRQRTERDEPRSFAVAAG